MLSKYIFHKILITDLLLLVTADSNCSDAETRSNFKFYLIKQFKQSVKERVFVDNVDSLEACTSLAEEHRGLAFNYSPKERYLKQVEDQKKFHDHPWYQPHLYFNCHILQCPENDKFKTLVNDTSFDYFSLYETSFGPSEFICLPNIGLFVLHTSPETFQNASLKCRQSEKYCATLAHVASQKRTEALTGLIASYNEQQTFQIKPRVYLTYIGLEYNSTLSNNYEFINEEGESLRCFSYRAWEPGNPRISSEFSNASCVGLTLNRSWRTVECERKLPFICEIWTTCKNNANYFKSYA